MYQLLNQHIPTLGYFVEFIILITILFWMMYKLKEIQASFTNRNKIKTQSGPTWLRGTHQNRKGHSSIINQVLIDNRSNWKRKHLIIANVVSLMKIAMVIKIV